MATKSLRQVRRESAGRTGSKHVRRADARLAARLKAFDETNNGYRGVRRPGSRKMRTN